MKALILSISKSEMIGFFDMDAGRSGFPRSSAAVPVKPPWRSLGHSWLSATHPALSPSGKLGRNVYIYLSPHPEDSDAKSSFLLLCLRS
jgi:hypothetical protein